jgi:hypothetical protein
MSNSIGHSARLVHAVPKSARFESTVWEAEHQRLTLAAAQPAKFKFALTRLGLKWQEGMSVRGRLCSS